MPTILKVCQDFVQGDSFVIKVSHNPEVDLTGGSFELILKTDEDSDTEVMSVTHAVPAGADATAGRASIPVLTTDTENVPPGKYFASLKRTLADGSVNTLVRSGKDNAGKVTVYKNLRG